MIDVPAAVRQLRPLFVGEVSGADAGGRPTAATGPRDLRRARPVDERLNRDLPRFTTRDVASTLGQVA
ncbi:MAG TPA: hypothetical protein VKF83_08455 [Stellaceae bacterium]|nr:hypothetical protein [Stellaceae bacterium]